MNKIHAQEWKIKGNEEFKQENFPRAIEYFTRALEFDPEDHIFYSNRSACYASIQEYEKALEDAKKCIELKPDWVRGYTRKALAEFYLEKYDKAIEAYNKALELDPESTDLKLGLEKAKEAQIKNMKEPILTLFQGPALVRLMSHPRTKDYFQQPDFIQFLGSLQTSQSRAIDFINDPRFMECVSVILGNESTNPIPHDYQEDNEEEISSGSHDEEYYNKKIAEEEKILGNAAFSKKK